ncbi:putative UDP-glucose 6-dehydrogenase [Methanobrevibacter arboriphilus JCM 13429 = DSM 1125]|uniref:UDP-glucose 6-dehydrogenase n=1 Tax=Methanobrevibacter arboriphilus JCM 13429 = DSM 1125 TaxID=1300164 RepID=A0A1V6N3Z0_METAZ|nr:UDP-glucose/GDP-mannose dehydrogenase family protein [Methanobrevibacter arboriphilus]OQD59381.1 putative UDP-glucose 6-dehydrogenase [Methanobrevibacter arboriphilus JCM 13429 = DSM 1125]
MNITVIGTGYVGLVTGTCFSEMGNNVYCIDIDEEKIKSLKNGIMPIYEQHLESMVIKNHNKGNLIFTTELKKGLSKSDICFIAVGTPMASDGCADLSVVFQVAKNIGELMSHDLIIVTKSTVPVGTGDKIDKIIQKELDKRGVNYNFQMVSNPEFLKEGTAVEDSMRPDRVIIGSEDEKTINMMKELYAPYVKNHDRFIIMDIRSAEMSKYASNAMLATRISFMNEIANICEKVGADVNKVRLGVGSDKRIGYSFLYAGCGYGGSCFPKDVSALIKTGEIAGYSPKILNEVESVNNNQKVVLVNKIREKFGENLSNLSFSIWGLSFKPGTDDMREAPSVVIINELIKSGANIKAYDPKAREVAENIFKNNENIEFCNSKYDVLNDSNGLIIVTEWNEFKSPDFNEIHDRLKHKIIFDGRNQFDKELLDTLGFEYYQIGC